jgi:hypothetical protein
MRSHAAECGAFVQNRLHFEHVRPKRERVSGVLQCEHGIEVNLHFFSLQDKKNTGGE